MTARLAMGLRSLLLRRFLENPHIGRQLASSFQSLALGFVFTLVTLALGAASSFALQSFIEMGSHAWIAERRVGPGLHLIHSFVLYGLLALLLPFRVAGSIDGPRNDKAFDQVVASGWSPLSLHLGNWALAWAYALLILIVSLPFAVFAHSLGGVTWGQIAWGYGLLALYAHVIIGVTLGLCMLETERRAALFAVLVFAGAGTLCAFSRLPPVFAEATPLRLLARWIAPAEPAAAMLGFWNEPLLFFFPLPLSLYPFLLWLLLLVPAVTSVLLGPSHRFTPGLNNFGQVVLPGDRKRKFFRRPRPFLNRRVELAFFYENRPRWLDAWDFLLRKSALVLWVLFLWGAITGLIFGGAPALPARGSFARGDGGYIASLLLTGSVLFVALLALADTRHRRWQRERIGPWRVPRSLLLGASAVFLIACFAALHVVSCEASSPALPAGDPFRRDFYSFLAVFTAWVANAFLLGRVLSFFSGTVAATVFLVIAGALGSLFVSVLIQAGVGDGWLPGQLAVLAFASPLTLLGGQGTRFKAAMEASGIEPAGGPEYALIIHALAGAALRAALVSLNRMAARARAEARSRGAAATAAAGLSFVLALAIAAPRPAAAGEALPLEVEVTRGFAGRVFGARTEYPFDFFTAVLRNRGDRPLEGTVSIEADGIRLGAGKSFTAPQGTTTVVRWSEMGMSPFWNIRGTKIIIATGEGRLEVDLPEAVEVRPVSEPGFRYLVVSEAGRPPEVVKSEHAWAAAKPFHLPEDLRAYMGASAVLVGPTDLSLWTRGQREALHDYLRLGGTVVFFGRIAGAGLKSAPEWEGLLAPRASSTRIAAGVELAIEELEDAAPVWSLDDGGKAVPLLSLRAVGPGRLGHLSFDPGRKLADLERLAGADVWDEFQERLPRSAFPTAIEVDAGLLRRLVDSSGLTALAACSLAYTAVLGPGLAIIFRKKKRRRWILVYILGSTLLFAAGTPALGLLLHSRPSPAALTRAVYFGPGARRGVAQARLEVRSNGRQRHEVLAGGARLRAFGTERFGWEPLPLQRGAGAPATVGADAGAGREESVRFRIDMAPWSARGALFVGDAARAEPIAGKVVYTKGTDRFAIEVVDLPAGNGPVVLAVEDVLGRGLKAFDLSRHASRAGSLRAEFPGSSATRGRLARQLGLAANPVLRPRALLAISGVDVPLSVSSPDVTFDASLAGASVEGASRPEDVAARGGQLFPSHEQTLILQELTIEIR